MLIRSIDIRNFLAFGGASVEFEPGLNVVLSPNEGGKSSLMRAIVASLFWNASSSSKSVGMLRRWGSETSFRLEMEFEEDGRSYRLLRDFEEGRQSLFVNGDSDPLRTGKRMDSYIREKLLPLDEDLFLRVCGVMHEDLGGVSGGRGALAERIEEILGGGWGEVTPSGVKKAVESRRGAIRRGMDRAVKKENLGPMKRLVDEVDLIESELGAASRMQDRRTELLRAVSDIQGKIDDAEKSLALLETKRQKADRCRELDSQLNDAADGMKSAQRRRERLRSLLDGRKLCNDRLAGYPSALRESDGEALDGFRSDLERESVLAAGIPSADRGISSLRSLGFVVSIILIATGLLGLFLDGPWFSAMVVLGLVIGLWTGIGFLRGRRPGGGGDTGDEIETLVRRRRGWAGQRRLGEAMDLLRGYVEAKNESERIEARLQEFSEGSTFGTDYDALYEALYDEFVASSGRWHALADDTEKYGMYRLDADSSIALDSEIDGKKGEIESLREALQSSQRDLAGIPEQDIGSKKEKLAALRDSLAVLERKIRVMDAVLENLEEARKGMVGYLSENLPSLAGRHLERITGGRYGEIGIDPVGLDLTLAPCPDDIVDGQGAGEVPVSISPEMLSRGTADQVYLSVRLALVDLIGGRLSLPIFLDDPFVHFDPRRRSEALGIIGEFSDEHQVILFTCDPYYSSIEGNIVRLDGPSG